jgi:hypothetical protein
MDDETAEIELVRPIPSNPHLGLSLDKMSSWNRIFTRHARYHKE